MHGLPDCVVSSEREGNITHPPARLAPRQGLLNLPHRFNELHGIVVVLLDPCGHGQHVNVKNNVLRHESRFLRQKLISPSTDLHLPRLFRCLPCLIKSHDNDRRPIASRFTGLFQKHLLPLFQADRIDDWLSLDTLQTRLQDGPLRAVQDQRDARNLRLATYKIQKVRHAGLPVQKGLVKVDVDHVRAGLHLLPGHRHRLVEFPIPNQTRKLRGSGDIGSLSNRGEGSSCSNRVGFQPGQGRGWSGRTGDPRGHTCDGFSYRGNVIRRRPTAPSHHV